MTSVEFCFMISPVMISLLEQAKQAMLQNSQDFSSELIERNWVSQTTRRALREFAAALRRDEEIDWKRYFAIYEDHRAAAKDPASKRRSLQIHDSGEANLQEIRAWIKQRGGIMRIIGKKKSAGPRLPSAEILIFALVYACDQVKEAADALPADS